VEEENSGFESHEEEGDEIEKIEEKKEVKE
jgi:hypothetical protein